jgi:hypothetical protein
LLSRDEVDTHALNEGSQPVCTVFHAGLLGGNMPDENERFFPSLGSGVRRVLHRFPFSRFSGKQYVNFI